MKIYIHYDFKDDPWGGGNQFLKALREHWRRNFIYAETAQDAQGILFNSHHGLDGAVRLRQRHPGKIFIHRLDGIMTLTRNDHLLDRIIYDAAGFLSDGIIFQSQWAQAAAYQAGCPRTKAAKVIFNAPDPDIFNSLGRPSQRAPVKLVASSWSTNPRKGFAYFEWLDKNLDFSRYAMTFIGHSPVSFRNIRHIRPQNSQNLSRLLKEHEIYVFAGQEDACSNGLVEALHCGLPVVFLESGSNAEIVQGGGVGFRDRPQLLAAIDAVARNYDGYQRAIAVPKLDLVAKQYYDFFEEIGRRGAGLPRAFGYVLMYRRTRWNILRLAHHLIDLGKRLRAKLKPRRT